MITLKTIPSRFLLILLISIPFYISCKDNENVTKENEEVVREATLEEKKQMLNRAAPQTNQASGDMAALNPEHGQPGHRCDIPVGAPLNGGAKKTNTSPAQGLQVSPVSGDKAPTTGKGLNPPHGEPGHRCDIKVGDPL